MLEELIFATANEELKSCSQEIAEIMFSVVNSAVTAIEAKDAYTRGHSIRVSEYCGQLGEALGLAAAEKETLRMAALLHDIGKIGISEAILNKKGRLEPDEFAAIKQHCALGEKILQPIKQLTPVIAGIRHHHERFDGKGYPDGLAGEEIPRIARVIAVADAFDAMTSSRSYRAALPFEDAMGELASHLGAQFDPRIVAAFLEMDRLRLQEVIALARQ